MPTPANPPVAPTFVDCVFFTPLVVSLFPAGAQPPPLDYIINPVTGTYCPPYTASGGLVAGYETYTEECAGLNANNGANCSDPAFPTDYVHDNYPCSISWASNGCVGTGFLDFNGDEIFAWQWEGQCPGCPTDPLLYLLNIDGDCLCYHGTPCPAGTCYCAASGDCIDCTPPDCPDQGDCQWDPDGCTWDCSGLPDCDPDQVFDFDECECVPRCTLPECWCEETSQCVDCTPDPGPGQHNCVWNFVTCEYDCDECDPGECWCEGSSACIPCTDPDCKDELHCEWDHDLCDWVCDDPDTICGPHRTWLGEPDCRCSGAGGVWNLQSRQGHYHAAGDTTGTGIDFHRADDTVPPFVLDVMATGNAADHAPRFVQDWSGRLLLVFLSGADALEVFSDDDGATWSDPTTVFTGATQVTIAEDRHTGLVLRAGLVSGEVLVTRQYPGDTTPGVELSTGVMLDDVGFHLQCATEGPLRWLLIGVASGAVVHFASADDGETWVSV